MELFPEVGFYEYTQKICKCDVAHQTHITLIPQTVLVATSKTVFVTSGVWDQERSSVMWPSFYCICTRNTS